MIPVSHPNTQCHVCVSATHINPWVHIMWRKSIGAKYAIMPNYAHVRIECMWQCVPFKDIVQNTLISPAYCGVFCTSQLYAYTYIDIAKLNKLWKSDSARVCICIETSVPKRSRRCMMTCSRASRRFNGCEYLHVADVCVMHRHIHVYIYTHTHIYIYTHTPNKS
jgi:hypothetical protein